MDSNDYHPPLVLKNPHVQTILASSRLRTRGTEPFRRASRARIVSTSQGTRLLGYHTPPLTHPPRPGLILLLHGWEGSTESAYMLSLGHYLSRRGYEVFRLNLRDHGDSHHLNPGLFHGALIEETEEAVGQMAREHGNVPFFLVGFSLGGNFALRIAMRQGVVTAPISNLKHVFAVSPPLDPLKTTYLLDRGPLVYRFYFLKKWKRSLRKKQTLYPHLYHFTPLLTHRTCMGLTEAIMPYFPEFPDCRTYFSRYTLTGECFQEITIPTTIIIAKDDPVVPIADFSSIPAVPRLTIYRHRYGGHCGFFLNLSLRSWCEEKIYDTIAQER